MNDGVIPEDPGWRGVIRLSLPPLLLPVLGLRQKAGVDDPPIVTMRRIVLAYVAAAVMVLRVVQTLFPFSAATPTPAVAYLLLALGPLSLAAVPWTRRRIVTSCARSEELLGSYRGSFFLSLAVVQSAALYGFVAAFLVGAVWPYLVGLLVSMLGYAAIVPTGGRIRQLDDELSRHGCPHSLRTALYLPVPDEGTT